MTCKSIVKLGYRGERLIELIESAFSHDSNEIPTTIPMFSGSGNMKRLVGILSDVWTSRKSEMAAINWNYIGNNVYLSSYT